MHQEETLLEHQCVLRGEDADLLGFGKGLALGTRHPGQFSFGARGEFCYDSLSRAVVMIRCETTRSRWIYNASVEVGRRVQSRRAA